MTEKQTLKPDPAAIMAIVLAVHEKCTDRSKEGIMDLSDPYGGNDGYMRQVMAIAEQFESWACAWVDFDALSDVWPYWLEDNFGLALMELLLLNQRDRLTDLRPSDCKILAEALKLPLLPEPRPDAEWTRTRYIYVLEYHEPGKRPNTTRQAKRKVQGVQDAIDWMHANSERAFLPAAVVTNSWRPEVVAILGNRPTATTNPETK